jgi:hypothetical protein
MRLRVIFATSLMPAISVFPLFPQPFPDINDINCGNPVSLFQNYAPETCARQRADLARCRFRL